ncbi:NPR2-domain-containing protein [Ramicandelaber brevisporus]|nr:NPR2-domain-containing protein [Ramicandelaber brevisporus]
MSPRLAKKGQLITRVLNYIIPSTNVCGTLSLLRLREYTIVSFPNIVVGADLERGVYKFNLCFVLNRHDDPSVYEAIVHRLSIVLSWLERERQILSNPQTKLKFATNLVNQLYHGLNVFSGECIIDLSEIGTLSINAFSSADPFPPSPVDLCDVPVLLINLGRLIDSSCDQTVLRILSFIDGTKNVAQIAELTETDPEYVIDALRELSAAGTKRPNGQQVIDYISHFKFTNRYAADAGLSRILHDISLQKECYQFLGFISETEYDENNSNNINNATLATLQLVRLYAEITPEYSIGDWMISIRFPIDRVDIRKFIAFGELKGLIRRIHKYPVFNPTMPLIGSPIASYNTLPQQHHSVNDANGNEMFLQIHSSPPPALQIELDERKSAIAQDERKPSVAQDVLDLLDGTRNYDQLSIHFRKTVEELDEWFSSDPRITFEYR